MAGRALLLPVVAFAAALALLTAEPAAGRKKFAKREDKKCEHCHQNRHGGGPRNLTGLYYQATSGLPAEVDEAKQRRVVDDWLDEVGRSAPDLVWGYTPIGELPDAEPPTYERVADHEVLRRLSLDLRQVPPSEKELTMLLDGRRTLEQLTSVYLRSREFRETSRLYHADLVRPRGGIFNKPASLAPLERVGFFGRTVWRSKAIAGERERGGCDSHKLVRVTPYWERDGEVLVCRETGSEALTAIGDDGEALDCASEAGQASGRCGCGPHLAFCFRAGDSGRAKRAMIEQSARVAVEIVTKDLPYTELLTADWTLQNGRLDHYYARLDGRLADLDDADVERKWRRVERGPEHAGVLTSHSYLNFFYNGRRWAQRTFETFLCHETTPDYDLLDEHEDSGPISYRRHPEARPDINVNSGRACAACHLQLDGLSRIKDRWDNFGQDWSETRPVPDTIRFLGDEVDGVDAFGRALANSDVFLDCAVSQAWEHMVGHRFQPDEVRTRRALLEEWKQGGLAFRNLLRSIARTDEYRAKANVKIMERELYRRSLERLTGVRWKVGGRRGLDVYYDKVGGMDYRLIESRDRTPGQGHSLVQYKAAAETCDAVVERDADKPRAKRSMLGAVDDVDARPGPAALTVVINAWYASVYGRPETAVRPADRRVLQDLYATVADRHSPRDGYKAVCTAMFASADFALY